MNHSFKAAARDAVFLLLLTVFFFSILEGGARLYFFVHHGKSWGQALSWTADPILVYRPRNFPALDDYGSLWVHDAHVSKKKPLDTFRVVAMGGSTTEGFRVPLRLAWPAQLQDELTGLGLQKSVQVLNAGIAGYGSGQLKNILPRMFELSPDMILLFSGWNLVGATQSWYGFVPSNIRRPEYPWRRKVLFWLGNHSLVCSKIIDWVGTSTNVHSNTLKIQTEIERIIPIHINNLTEIIRKCRQHKIRVGLIAYPRRGAAQDSNLPIIRTYNKLISSLQRLAQKEDVPLFDVRPGFSNLPSEQRTALFEDYMHPTGEGNALIAKQLAPLIAPYIKPMN